ncbi:MAG: sigma-70 family RNA polymerase sigma factor [Ignavibacteria bacterium]|nr:sigma-70 family RNA polymerase sigma factor [Ignavibacteria bacterium]
MKRITNISELSDFELCLALSQNNKKAEQAFTEIYNRYSNKVFAYILRTINNRTDAKDIFQEVFLRFFDACKNGTNATNILPYLIKIARNICLNYIRDKKTTVPFDESIGFIKSSIDVEKSEISELVTNALSILDYQSREIFVLHHYQNLTFNEISDIIGESLAFVKTRYYRGKEKMKTFLTPYFKKDY